MKIIFISAFCLILFGCAHTVRVQDKNGHPIGDAKVELVRFSLAPEPIKATNSKGKFTYPRLSLPALESISVSKNGYDPFYVYAPKTVPRKIILKKTGEPVK